MNQPKTMSNSVESKNCNMGLIQVLKTAKNLDRIANESACEKAEQTTNVNTHSEKLELKSSPLHLEILSVKENNGQVMIEYRAPSTAATLISGTDDDPVSNLTNQEGITEIKVEDEIEFGATSISVQSIPTVDDERHNYLTVQGESTAIKLEDDVDIKIEDEMEFLATSISSRIACNDEKKHNNQAIEEEDEVDIKMEDEIEFGELSTSVHSISTTDGQTQSNQTIQDKLEEIKDEMEFYDEVKKDVLNTPEITVTGKSVELKVNENKSEFVCGICPKKYFQKSCLYQHRLRHGKPNFHCTICGVNKFTQMELDSHKRLHELCAAALNTPKTAVAKKSAKKSAKKNSEFICDICSNTFLKEKYLNAHRLRHGKPNFHCTICGVAKFTQYELNGHMKANTHDKPKDFTCDICSVKFSMKSLLTKHQKRHDKPKFQCSICSMPKFTQEELDIHVKTHVNNPIHFTCDICSRNYFSEKHLNMHRKRHDTANFPCTVCGLLRFTKLQLEKHMRTHDKPRIYAKRKSERPSTALS